MGYWPGAQKQDQKTVNAVVKGEVDTTARCSPGPQYDTAPSPLPSTVWGRRTERTRPRAGWGEKDTMLWREHVRAPERG